MFDQTPKKGMRNLMAGVKFQNPILTLKPGIGSTCVPCVLCLDPCFVASFFEVNTLKAFDIGGLKGQKAEPKGKDVPCTWYSMCTPPLTTYRHPQSHSIAHLFRCMYGVLATWRRHDPEPCMPFPSAALRRRIWQSPSSPVSAAAFLFPVHGSPPLLFHSHGRRY